MENKKIVWGTLAMALVFSLLVIGCPNETPETPNNGAIDTGTTIAGCEYSGMEEDSGTWEWSYKHYLLSVSYEEALSALKEKWGESSGAYLYHSSDLAESARETDGVIFEINDDDYPDYRLVEWDQTKDAWYGVSWSKREGRTEPQDTGTTIADLAYSEKDQDSGVRNWSYKHYLLSATYETALSALKEKWGESPGWASLQHSSELAEEVRQTAGVIFEISGGDYPNYRLIEWDEATERWSGVSWSKQEGMTEPQDTGTTIADLAYTQKAEDSGSTPWSYEHHLLSANYETALSALKAKWGEPDYDTSLSRDSEVAESARQNGGVLFEISAYDYRLLEWDETKKEWSGVAWRKQARIIADETDSTIAGFAYSEKDEDSGSDPWSYKNYLLTISYEEALSILTAHFGEPMTGWSLQNGSTLADEAYQNNGVIFEETSSNYRLCRVVNGRWEAVGWNKE
jgi:hypothetical protein